MNRNDARGSYLDRLPIGERISAAGLRDDPLFPLEIVEGQLSTHRLEAPTIPEPVRLGEPGGGPCPNCSDLETGTIWSNAQWLVRADPAEPHGLPMVALLVPRAHHDLEDLPDELAVGLGPMIQRVARAVGDLPEVGRVHVARWGDGSEHFHVWFLARPLGMWQMRGAMLAVWDDLLPKVPDDAWRANVTHVAGALAAVDGRSHIAIPPEA